MNTAEQQFRAGDKVNYSKSWSGGYAWKRSFPAVVVSVGKKTVRIRMVRRVCRGEPCIITQCVKPEKLSPRTSRCEFESLLECGR